MATLGQIFGQQRQGFQQFLEPDRAKPTQAFISSAGTLNRQMTPATPAPQAPTQTPFVRRTPTPVQTPVAPNVPAPTPTIGQTYQNFVAPTISKEQEAEEKALGIQTREAKKLATDTVNQSAILDDVMSRYQAEIDAINQIYAQTASEARQQGLGTLGSSRAIQARSGLLGSDFGASQTANIEGENARIMQTIQAEKGAKIQEIIGRGRAEAAQEIADKRRAIQEGLQSYVTYLGAQTERRNTKLAGLAQALIDQGVRPDELDPTQIAELAKSYGVNPQDISSAYTSRERELLASQGADGFTLSEGQERYEFNPATGAYQLIAAGAPKATTPAKLTDAQAKAGTFATRMEQADTVINDIGSQFAGLGAYVGQNLPNPLKSSDRQRFEQAKRNFINSVLRRESGAVISDQEFANAEQQYFPQPGDRPEVLEQKQQNRDTAIQGIKNESGGGAAQGGSQMGDSGFAEEW
jgi:hypothetical protein